MVASCIVLVGISYIMLDILSGIVIVPKTRVEEISIGGELVIDLEEAEILSMHVSGDGRFLAFIERPRGGARAMLKVFEMEGERDEIYSQDVDGSQLAWLGFTPYLVFENEGDIFVLNLEEGAGENLTSSSAYDGNPLPSPDGRYILWTIAPEGPTSEGAGFWIMSADGSGKEYLAGAQALAAWDPAGGTVISLHDREDADPGTEYIYLLQTAVLGGEGWNDYFESDNDVEYIWWPAQDTILCVGPENVKGEDMIKGVWFMVKQPDQIKKVGSTEGLGLEETYYRFYPSRTEQRLAYVGRKGLEYFDYEERAIYRYAELGARPPLAWDEINNALYFVGQDGIYYVALEGN